MIEVRGLSKRYGPAVAVADLSFMVRPGRVTGFLGPNGSGKSTTLRMIIGPDYPDAGYACISGPAYRELRWPHGCEHRAGDGRADRLRAG